MIADFELRPDAPSAVATRVCLDEFAPQELRERILEHFEGRRVVLVADRSVHEAWPDAIALDEAPLLVPPGEAAKTHETLIDVCRELARRALGRDSALVSFGGGACGDLCAMAASVYMRGVPVAHVPSSLLAMVDAALGGKCAIDIPEGKNLVGSFWNASLLLVDPRFLSSLPARELHAGFGEIAKYGLGFDRALLGELEALPVDVVSDPARAARELPPILDACLRIKARVVEHDMRERSGGPREHLNLGHTVAHALEAHALAHGGLVPHGLAVAFGLRVAVRLACARGAMLAEESERFEELLDHWSMPRSVAELYADTLDPVALPDEGALTTYFARDKKQRAGEIRVILPLGLGRKCRAEVVDARELVEHTLREAGD